MPSDLKNYNSFCLPWRELPGAMPADIEIFAVGDVHGQAELFARVLGEIRDTPHDEKVRHLVILGDLIDRGPASIEAVDLAMRAGELAAADELHVLHGNHDIAMMLSLEQPEHLDFWLLLGGGRVLSEAGVSVTESSWEEITDVLKSVLHPDYLYAISSGPTHLHLCDLLFVHAGICPQTNRDEFLGLSRRLIQIDDHWATIRNSFLTHQGGWDHDDPDPIRRELNPTVVVHGHTPALRQDLTTADDLDICDGVEGYRTVALDIGAAYRTQLAFAHFRSRAGKTEVQIRAVSAGNP